jgi:hypothetical protein
MVLATEGATLHFLEGLWFRHGQAIIKAIAKEYNLNEEQIELLENTLLRPNDWVVNVLPPLESKNK